VDRVAFLGSREHYVLDCRLGSRDFSVPSCAKESAHLVEHLKQAMELTPKTFTSELILVSLDPWCMLETK
jgi:hypothetical protein